MLPVRGNNQLAAAIRGAVIGAAVAGSGSATPSYTASLGTVGEHASSPSGGLTYTVGATHAQQASQDFYSSVPAGTLRTGAYFDTVGPGCHLEATDRTNLTTHNEDLTQSPWFSFGVTTTATDTGVTGATTAHTITDADAANSRYIHHPHTITSNTNQIVFYGWVKKSASNPVFAVQVQNGGFTRIVFIDPANGAHINDGWDRVSIVERTYGGETYFGVALAVANASQASALIRFYPAARSDTSAAVLVASTTGSNVLDHPHLFHLATSDADAAIAQIQHSSPVVTVGAATLTHVGDEMTRPGGITPAGGGVYAAYYMASTPVSQGAIVGSSWYDRFISVEPDNDVSANDGNADAAVTDGFTAGATNKALCGWEDGAPIFIAANGASTTAGVNHTDGDWGAGGSKDNLLIGRCGALSGSFQRVVEPFLLLELEEFDSPVSVADAEAYVA